MKNNLLAFLTIGISTAVSAQTFTDNFESYTAGSYLGPQSAGAWTTWSNAPGTAEDVLVSSADAFSGTKSLYFSSTSASGGPVDLVRNFGVLNTVGTVPANLNVTGQPHLPIITSFNGVIACG